MEPVVRWPDWAQRALPAHLRPAAPSAVADVLGWACRFENPEQALRTVAGYRGLTTAASPPGLLTEAVRTGWVMSWLAEATASPHQATPRWRWDKGLERLVIALRGPAGPDLDAARATALRDYGSEDAVYDAMRDAIRAVPEGATIDCVHPGGLAMWRTAAATKRPTRQAVPA